MNLTPFRRVQLPVAVDHVPAHVVPQPDHARPARTVGHVAQPVAGVVHVAVVAAGHRHPGQVVQHVVGVRRPPPGYSGEATVSRRSRLS